MTSVLFLFFIVRERGDTDATEVVAEISDLRLLVENLEEQLQAARDKVRQSLYLSPYIANPDPKPCGSVGLKIRRSLWKAG